MAIAVDCKEKSNASDEDIESLFKNNMPQKEEAKCLVTCLMEQMQIVYLFKSKYFLNNYY